MLDLSTLARWLILIGLILTGLGGLIWIVARTGLPLGHLPGDFHIKTKGISCFIPLASSILISILLTLILNLILRLMNK